MTNTDLYKSLKTQEVVLLERVNNTEGKWKAYWESELQAVRRCLWALALSPYLTQV